MAKKENTEPEKSFTLGTHYFLKGVQKAGISFPSSKKDCMLRARNIKVRQDFDKEESLAGIISQFEWDYYENADSFVAAYVRLTTKDLLKDAGIIK